MTAVLPREALIAEARRLAEAHTDWDQPASFAAYTWTGTELAARHATIIGNVLIADYPDLMMTLARDYAMNYPADPAFAFALQIELELDDPVAEPDEGVLIVAGDIDGRLAVATCRRSLPGVIREFFYPPASPHPPSVLADGLLAAANATATLVHHRPRPRWVPHPN